MAAQIPLKIASGKIQRMVASTDFISETIGGTGETSFTRGDILAGDAGGGLTRLALGTSGYVLSSDGTDVVWATAPDSNTFTATNANAGTLAPGTVVYASAAGSIDKAKGDAASTSNVVGLNTASVSASATATIRSDGLMTLTTGQWDTAFGTTGGLAQNATYYLSAATAGLGTATAPNTTGQELFAVGVGLSTTKLLVKLVGPYTL